MRLRDCALLAALLVATPIVVQAADKESAKAEKPDNADKPANVAPPTVSVTRHSLVAGGQTIAYKATAGETYLKDKEGQPLAAIFSTAYVKEGVTDPTTRPVTFLYNGGPGSGSLWLHMGAFGPKRVVLPPDAKDDGAPPYRIIDNTDTLLDVTDIVFIDPVGTGFSRALGKTDPKDYWGITKDAESIAAFIRRWLNENGRWNSPKFIGGESYGTTRSAALVNQLEGQYNDVALDGIILISTVLDFGVQAEVEGNEMAYVINLPSMAATAWYHNKVPNRPADVSEFAQAARQFALGPYAAALIKGNALPAAEHDAIRKQLAGFLGLSETYLENANLRVLPGRFYKELLRDQGLTVGRLDTRYTGKDYDNAGEEPDNDPSFYGIDASYTAAVNSYIRDTLKFSPERDYVTIGGVRDWDWQLKDGRDSNFYVNVAPYIGRALRENSGLKVFVGQGYFDMATPFLGAEYALGRPGIPADRIQFHYYGAGHMMYVRGSELTALARDVRSFIRSR